MSEVKELTTEPLYHGTDCEIRYSEVRKSKGTFGRELYDAFYVTTDIERALKYAVFKYMGNRETGKITVNEYVYNPSEADNKLKGTIFDAVNPETVRFIHFSPEKW